MGQQFQTVQPSFAAGELSPSIRGRVDLQKYRVGAALMRNFFALPYGGAATRAGTAVCARCKQVYGTPPRLIDFVFNQLQAYALEFGNLYMRVIMNGGYVLEPGKVLTALSASLDPTFFVTGHGWSSGDWIWVNNATGALPVNTTPGKIWVVNNVTSADTFTVKDLDGNTPDASAWGAYTGSSGTAARVFTLVTPYASADLAGLKFTQNADTLTVTSTAYAQRNITRTAHYIWTIATVTYAALVQPPTALVGTALNPGGVGGQNFDYRYVVTAVYDATGEESVASAAVGVTNKNIASNVNLQNQITWTAPATGPTPDRYRVYGSRGVLVAAPTPTVFGYMGETTALNFIDPNIDADFTRTPPLHRDPFATYGNPGCATHFQGRKWFGGMSSFPETLVGSKAGNFTNMDYAVPSRADDSIVVTLTSRQVNAIKHLISLNQLIALSSAGAWLVSGGDQNTPITPDDVQARPQAYNGCGDVAPLTVGSDVLYVQARGAKIRTLSFDFYSNLFTGVDMSVLSSHFFYGFNVLQWAYAEEPFYQAQAVRDDGKLLNLTYLKEQDVYAWSASDSYGNSGVDKFRSVCSIPEGNENAIYYIMERTAPGVRGGLPYYVSERKASRNFLTAGVADPNKAWCLDSATQRTGAGITSVSGLEHLEGCTLGVYVDGSVQADKVVAGGAVTLDAAGATVLVGLRYTCQLQTLRIDPSGDGQVLGRKKKITTVDVITETSRGIKVAPMIDTLSGVPTPGTLYPMRERNSSLTAGQPLPLFSGIRQVTLEPAYQVDGAVFFQVDDPVPATILAVIPRTVMGDDPG